MECQSHARGDEGADCAVVLIRAQKCRSRVPLEMIVIRSELLISSRGQDGT
jgi:hypothetical protein